MFGGSKALVRVYCTNPLNLYKSDIAVTKSSDYCVKHGIDNSRGLRLAVNEITFDLQFKKINALSK